MGDNGADGGSVAASTPPDLNHDLVADALDVALDVLEGAGQGAAGALDGDITAVDGDLNYKIHEQFCVKNEIGGKFW